MLLRTAQGVYCMYYERDAVADAGFLQGLTFRYSIAREIFRSHAHLGYTTPVIDYFANRILFSIETFAET